MLFWSFVASALHGAGLPSASPVQLLVLELAAAAAAFEAVAAFAATLVVVDCLVLLVPPEPELLADPHPATPSSAKQADDATAIFELTPRPDSLPYRPAKTTAVW